MDWENPGSGSLTGRGRTASKFPMSDPHVKLLDEGPMDCNQGGGDGKEWEREK